MYVHAKAGSQSDARQCIALIRETHKFITGDFLTIRHNNAATGILECRWNGKYCHHSVQKLGLSSGGQTQHIVQQYPPLAQMQTKLPFYDLQSCA